MITAIMGFVQTFLGSKIGPAFFLVVGVAGAMGWALAYHLDNQNEQLLLDKGLLKGQVDGLADDLDAERLVSSSLVDQRNKDAIASARLRWEFDLVEKEKDEANAKITSYRSRWTMGAHKKPGLMSRLINRATDKRVQSFYDRTCRADCDQNGNSEVINTGANQTPADSEG